MIQFHAILHGLCTSRGPGTASFKDKLFHNLTAMMEEVLYEIFLDINKVHDFLDCGFCLNTLGTYGVGPRAMRLLRKYWYQLSMLAWAGGYFGSHSKGKRGVTQGGPISTTIFNVVVDAVMNYWVSVVEETEGGTGPE